MKVLCADLFCGAGGTSNGLVEAASELGIEVDLVAINHWPTAIATHTANHPWARHICARVEEIRPCEVVPRGRLHLLVASPECTFHSIARGGRPIEDQKRVPAWGVIQWAQELYIDNIIIENVPEFIRWGPLGANGKPLKSKVGETYQAFLQALRSLGYRVVYFAAPTMATQQHANVCLLLPPVRELRLGRYRPTAGKRRPRRKPRCFQVRTSSHGGLRERSSTGR